MEGIQTFFTVYVLLMLVWCILCLILFFKVWGMTNDVRALKEHFLSIETPKTSYKTNNSDGGNSDNQSLQVGDHVTEKTTGNELVIHSITDDGKYVCKFPNENTTIFAGTFSEEQLSKI